MRAAGADIVIAVVVDRDLPRGTDIETAKDVLYRAGEITANTLEAAELQNADVVIRPAVDCTGLISAGRTPSSGSEKKPPANRWKRFTPLFRWPDALPALYDSS